MPSQQLLRAQGGDSTVQIWDPLAHHVWLVCKSDNEQVPLTRNERGVWQTSCRQLSASEEYAFIAEWTQKWAITSETGRFGFLRELGGLDDADAPDCDKELPGGIEHPCGNDDATPVAGNCAEDDGACEETIMDKRPPSPAEILGTAEFCLEVQDFGRFAVDATGVRVTLLISPRVSACAVSISSADKSWGPVPLQLAEGEGDTSASVACWVGDVVDLEFGSMHPIDVHVRRRDWRIDPCSLVLSPGRIEDPFASETFPQTPHGPATWSVHSQLPKAPPTYVRCSDREIVLYELHLGSFTPEGTVRAATAKLQHIRNLGCSALSLMPIHQDLLRMKSGAPDFWGYDVMSFFALDAVYGTLEDFTVFVDTAHQLGLAVIIDFVVNHMMWGADGYVGPQYFDRSQITAWGPRPDFSIPEVREHSLAAAEILLLGLNADGLRIDSTKSIRKYPDGGNDAAGTSFLGELAALCRQHGKLAIAEDLEDGDGVLQFGGLGLHMQWDMAFFNWSYDALVNPMDEHRDINRVVDGLKGLSPARSHVLRGRVIFMESHDTATSDRYGRFAAAVHNGKSFMPLGNGSEHSDCDGDAFQKIEGALPYPSVAAVEADAFAARRAAIGLVLMMTAPGIPMILQGQEVFECRPYKWPRGPALDWNRVAACSGSAALYKDMLKKLNQLRLAPFDNPDGVLMKKSPFQGDGFHACHQNAGVLAYLRWSEPEDSRYATDQRAELALVVLNCSNSNFPAYVLGVPPSKRWRLVFSTISGNEFCNGEVSGNVYLNAAQHTAKHSFPCSLPVTLPPYCASVFLRAD